MWEQNPPELIFDLWKEFAVNESAKNPEEYIESCYKLLFGYYKNDYKSMTALMLCLGDKVLYWGERNEKICHCYVRLWYRTQKHIIDTFTWRQISHLYWNNDVYFHCAKRKAIVFGMKE